MVTCFWVDIGVKEDAPKSWNVREHPQEAKVERDKREEALTNID